MSATRGGERVVVTAFGPDAPETTVHDGRTGELLAGPLVGPWRNSVSLDGHLLAATGGTLTRYDLETLEPLGDLPGARGEINLIQFSDDGRTVMAASNDQTVSLYDLATGIRLGDPIPIESPLGYGGFLRPDGLQLAVTTRPAWSHGTSNRRHCSTQLASSPAATSPRPSGPPICPGSALAARPAPPQVDRTFGESCGALVRVSTRTIPPGASSTPVMCIAALCVSTVTKFSWRARRL